MLRRKRASRITTVLPLTTTTQPQSRSHYALFYNNQHYNHPIMHPFIDQSTYHFFPFLYCISNILEQPSLPPPPQLPQPPHYALFINNHHRHHPHNHNHTITIATTTTAMTTTPTNGCIVGNKKQVGVGPLKGPPRSTKRLSRSNFGHC